MKKKAKEYVADFIKEDEGLCDFLIGFLDATYSQGFEDSVERKKWRIVMEGIKKFSPVSTEELLKRCQDILNKSHDGLVKFNVV